MNGFCIDTVRSDPMLRPHHGVLRDAALLVTADARVAAEQILANAHREAEAVLRQAREEAQQAVQDAQQQTIEQAQHLITTLQNAHTSFYASAESIVLDLAQALFDRLVIDLTPRKRLAATLKRVLQEAPPRLVTPILRVHPDDVNLLPVTEWEVKPDPSLTRSTCRLEASSGEWAVDFEAAVVALKEALTAGANAATQE